MDLDRIDLRRPARRVGAIRGVSRRTWIALTYAARPGEWAPERRFRGGPGSHSLAPPGQKS